MNNRRKENWPVLLQEFIQGRKAVGFDWKKQNCCFFACDWIRLCTNVDPAKGLRVKGSTLKGAATLLKSMGGVEGIATSRCAKHGFPSVAINFAQRGDIVLVDLNSFNNPTVNAVEDNSLGVVVGSEAAFVGRDGLKFIPVTACRLAWRIC